MNIPILNKTLISLLLLSFFSCSQSSDSDVFESENLRGKYKVDLTPLIAENFGQEEDDNEWESVGKGLASMALSSIKIDFNFYENNKGIMNINKGIFNAFVKKGEDSGPIEFKYKVENDSVLYMKKPSDQDFVKWAVVKKYSNSYDYIKLLILEKGEGKVYFNLSKTSE